MAQRPTVPPNDGVMELADASRRRHAVRFIVFVEVVSLFADMTYEGARSITVPFLAPIGPFPVE